MTEWMRGNELEKRRLNGDLGGTMRLGAYPAALTKGSKVAKKSSPARRESRNATATATR